MTSPLVTFVVIGYRQEQYIREAIEGAFSQTYSPLEIILSDDASPDRTFEIMRDMAAEYKGPHSIRLNRRTKNKGFASHINEFMGLASGELVVMAAGDDISCKERVEILVRNWIFQGKPSGVGSGTTMIDQHGNGTGEMAEKEWLNESIRFLKTIPVEALPLASQGRRSNTILVGCAAAWSKDNWNFFGELDQEVINEDEVLSFRACLKGGLALIDQALVFYRSHEGNIWSAAIPQRLETYVEYLNNEKSLTRRAGFTWSAYKNMLKDVMTARSKGILPENDFEELQRLLTLKIQSQEIRVSWWGLPVRKKIQYALFNSVRQPLSFRILGLFSLASYCRSRLILAKLKRHIFV